MQNSDYPDEIDPIVKSVDSKNSAQSIHKYFRNMKGDRNRTRKRWIWELLQNACDASAKFATIVRKPDAIIFRHDGKPFDLNEAVHLIRHGSTKTEDDKTRGQFGSGFLTTHLLSPAIYVSGQIDDGRSFQFHLERGVDDSADEIRSKIDDACRELSESLHSRERNALNSFTTEFRYPIENGDPANSDAVSNAVKEGIKMLELCAPLVIAFNKEIKRIDIKSHEETTSFEKSDSQFLQENMQQITVSEDRNGERKNHTYVLAGSEEVSVAILTKPLNNSRVCGNMGDMPKLFLDFPLVGTENFSFPAVINSLEFDPEDNRDGVRLKETEAKSWGILEEACKLLVAILKFSATRGWRNVYSLANIPDIRERDWLNSEWLQKVIDRFVTEIRKTPTVVVGAGNPVSPEEAILPIAKTTECVETLWCLLGYMQENSARLPEKEETVGWCNAIKSWMTVPGQHSDIGFNCQKLAEEIDKKVVENKNAGQIKAIESVLRLKHGVNAIKWLSRFHALIEQEGLRNETADCRIVPAQDGQLRKLSELHRDEGVAEELKDTAELLGWHIREDLRHGEITSLNEESGAGNQDNKSVVKTLIDELRTRSDGNMDDAFAKASVGVFKWIAEQKNWDFLRDFPAFAIKDSDDKQRQLITLRRHQQVAEDTLHLAPIRSWPEDLQPYSELFPESHILADDFFEATPDSDVWQALDKEGFVKNGVIIKKDSQPIPDPRPENGKKHRPEESVTVTTVAFLKGESGIRSKIRGSKRLARLFWCFLVDWLLVQEPQGLENQLAKCTDCEEEHRYSLAEWLVPVKENKWVPVGNRELPVHANAESLGALFRDNSDEYPRNSEGLNKLLHAIGVRNPDSLRFELADSEKQKTLINLLNSGNLDIAREIVEDIKDDPELPAYLADRRKQAHTRRENHRLGKRVEEIVREILEKEEGFKVNKIHAGADFEITPNPEVDDVTKFELVSPSQSRWLVEVKSTRQGPDGVRMTLVQAREARNSKENYLLCVVPLDGKEPEKSIIREKMRFVQNIGNLVTPLCDKFDRFKGQLDDITCSSEDQGVQLTISSGTERILVKSSVWKDENAGFSLDALAKKLKR